ncbi:MAG: site-specific DNA-methyltransferase, partial [bacterium]|nr:site-specific DNA-methyltransferase [bacterium]
MPKKPSKKEKEIKIEAYSHAGKKRKNNPPIGLVSSATDKLNGYTKYAHDPYIDPYLSWAGKTEGSEVNVRNISLHVHERIDSTRIIKAFLTEKVGIEKQPSLFEGEDNELPLGKAFEFYSHDQDWTNRLIAGDSLLVMNSLLKKEGMAGEVQMVYIDPPYGIKYNSNFQPFVNKREVKDNNDADIPAEPETIKAFRDTWELGIHSYLSYLYDRLLLARECLNESGSCFVQINDLNVHYVKALMQEVFGQENFMSVIPFRTSAPLGSSGLPTECDFVIWFARKKEKVKFRQLYTEKHIGMGTNYMWVEFADGTRRRLAKEEAENPRAIKGKIFYPSDLASSGYTPSCTFDFEFEGKTIRAGKKSWRTNPAGIAKLIQMKRIMTLGEKNRPCFLQYIDDNPVQTISNLWVDTRSAMDKIYVVETDTEVIKRCLLMTTDPGDLVIDPTCGSGTTAFVAEQWGRRWITIDTSRVAVTLAKQRLMTASFDYYKLAHSLEGISSGLEYKKVPHVTLGSIANDERGGEETLYDQPLVDKSKVRVTGPFTVEALPSLRTKPFDGKEPKIATQGDEIARTGETANQTVWRDELKTSGIRATGG